MRWISLLVLLLPVIFCAELKLRIIHTNDLLYQFHEFASDGGECLRQTTTVSPTSSSTSVPTTTVSVTSSASTTNIMSSSSTGVTTAETSPETPASTESSTEQSSEPSVTTSGSTLDATTVMSPVSTSQEGSCYGGVARHVTKIMDLKSDTAHRSLFICTGGVFGSSMWYQTLKASAAVKITKDFLQPDVLVPSYIDFKESFMETIKYLEEVNSSSVPVVASNFWYQLDGSEEKLTFQPYIEGDFNGTKYAVIGFVSKKVQEYLPKNAGVKDEMEVIGNLISQLQQKNIHIMIVAGSSSIEEAKEILTRHKEIDVIVGGGGDSYFMYNTDGGNPPDTPSATYPYDQKGTLNTKQLAVQVPHRGKYIGNLVVTFSANGALTAVDSTSNPILLDDSVSSDNATLAYVESLRTEVEENAKKHVGNTQHEVSASNCTSEECTLGDLIAVAVYQYIGAKAPLGFTDRISASFWRSGLMANSVTKGPITMGQLSSAYPSDITIGHAKITGSALKKLLELSWDNKGSGNYLQFYGAKVVYELAKPKGSRLKEVSTVSSSGSYVAVQDEEEVTVAVDTITLGSNVYKEVFDGKRNYFQFHNASVSEDHSSLDALTSFLSPDSTVTVINEGRISFFVEPPPPAGTDYTGTVFLTIFITLLVEVVLYCGYIFVWPKFRDRRGSMVSLLR